MIGWEVGTYAGSSGLRLGSRGQFALVWQQQMSMQLCSVVCAVMRTLKPQTNSFYTKTSLFLVQPGRSLPLVLLAKTIKM